LSVFVEGLKNQELMEALRASDGLCLHHLKQALEQVKDGSSCEQLIALQREKMISLRQELDEFIRKNDYQNFQEGFGKEGDAWLRAVAMVVGKKK
jgi:DNA-binding transcriptional MerR regulator